MTNKSKILLFFILFSCASYGSVIKRQTKKTQKVITEQKKPIVEAEYSPEKSGQYNPNILVLLDDTIVSIYYAWDYCFKLKKGQLLYSCPPKEAIDNWGEKGRYGAVLYK